MVSSANELKVIKQLLEHKNIDDLERHKAKQNVDYQTSENYDNDAVTGAMPVDKERERKRKLEARAVVADKRVAESTIGIQFGKIGILQAGLMKGVGHQHTTEDDRELTLNNFESYETLPQLNYLKTIKYADAWMLQSKEFLMAILRTLQLALTIMKMDQLVPAVIEHLYKVEFLTQPVLKWMLTSAFTFRRRIKPWARLTFQNKLFQMFAEQLPVAMNQLCTTEFLIAFLKGRASEMENMEVTTWKPKILQMNLLHLTMVKMLFKHFRIPMRNVMNFLSLNHDTGAFGFLKMEDDAVATLMLEFSDTPIVMINVFTSLWFQQRILQGSTEKHTMKIVDRLLAKHLDVEQVYTLNFLNDIRKLDLAADRHYWQYVFHSIHTVPAGVLQWTTRNNSVFLNMLRVVSA